MNCVLEKKETDLLSLEDAMFLGKYKGLSISELISRDPNYVCWALKNIGKFKLDDEAEAMYRNKKFW